MAKVIMPLMSIWAVGTLAKSITFRSLKNCYTVSRYERIPKKWSEKQIKVRELFKQKIKRFGIFFDKEPQWVIDTYKPDKYNLPKV